MDAASAVNPRRALIRRELEAGAQPASQPPRQAPAAQAQPQPVQFQRPFTAVERAAQARKLAEFLRARQ